MSENNQRELHENMEFCRWMAETIGDYAIFMLDQQGYIKTWNIRAEKIKDYKPNEIIVRRFSIFYTPEDLKIKHPEQKPEAAVKKKKIDGEGWCLRKDGTRFCCAVLEDNNGQLRDFSKITRLIP